MLDRTGVGVLRFWGLGVWVIGLALGGCGDDSSATGGEGAGDTETADRSRGEPDSEGDAAPDTPESDSGDDVSEDRVEQQPDSPMDLGRGDADAPSEDAVVEDTASEEPNADSDQSNTDVVADSEADFPDLGDCAGIGRHCTDETPCPDPLECYIAGDSGVCGKARARCGGFASARCNEPGAPYCLYLVSTDYGLCASLGERDCICDGARDVISRGCLAY
jgi:hypothetical protein